MPMFTIHFTLIQQTIQTLDSLLHYPLIQSNKWFQGDLEKNALNRFQIHFSVDLK